MKEGRAEPGLLEVALIFFRIGALGFGGGATTLAMLHEEFCARRRILSEEEFQLLFGLSRLLPGMNLLSLTVLLGHRCRRMPGAVTALAGLTIPSFSLILLGCRLLGSGHPSPYLNGILHGLAPAAAALLIHTAWQLCLKPLRRQRPLPRLLAAALMLAGAALTLAKLLSALWIILGGAVLGALLSRWVAEETA
jgi:chromate transporter